MLTLGSLAFASPWLLVALLGLPIIWWLLRITPPSPQRVRFPPIRLLVGLARTEETPAHTPPWLLALRLLIVGLMIVGLAEPLLNPDASTRGNGPLLVVVDNGWTAAPAWQKRVAALEDLIEHAERDGRPVAIAPTAPQVSPGSLNFQSPTDARARAAALRPEPLLPDRAGLGERLASNMSATDAPQIVWLSDGLDHGSSSQFSEQLASIAKGSPVTIVRESRADLPMALVAPQAVEGGISVRVVRAVAGGSVEGRLHAYGKTGRAIGETPFVIETAERETTALFELPVELRNRIVRIEIDGMRAAGSVALLDGRWRRRPVGLVSGAAIEQAQPLLADLYYLERALQPYVELRGGIGNDTGESEIQSLLQQGIAVLVLADVGQLVGGDLEAVEKWVEDGGVLIRFAGPRLARQSDSLLPVKIRRGGRALGGALSWTEPQSLALFDDTSPFSGVAIAEDIAVYRQVLAEPSVDLGGRTWASLTDGTPLVTGGSRGNGWVVLFHVTANSEWSSLPLSGSYIRMLRRLVDLSEGLAGTGEDLAATAPQFLSPWQILDGYGQFQPPPPQATPIPAITGSEIVPGPKNPPGLYGREDSYRSLNPNAPDATLGLWQDSSLEANFQSYTADEERPLKAWFIFAALCLLLVDGLVALALAGRIRPRSTGLGRSAAAILAAMLVVASASPRPAEADELADAFALKATLETRLAFVVTGDTKADEMSAAGLAGLSHALRTRTAVEPAEPLGVNIERDELSFFPLIYWPMVDEQPDPSPAALAKIDKFMKRGGTVLFDTLDQQRTIEGLPGRSAGPGAEVLQRLLNRLDIPPLEPVPEDHVLTKAFYLLQTFPGRWAGGTLWVESTASEMPDVADTAPANNDGVSSIIIGSNDYAAAWARDEWGRPLVPVVPGGDRQRELATRFGINLVMYSLTGNYKADQVHVPALLERLGQ